MITTRLMDSCLVSFDLIIIPLGAYRPALAVHRKRIWIRKVF